MASGSARHQWNTGDSGLASHLGDGGFLLKSVGKGIEAIGKPFAKAANKKIADQNAEQKAAESEAKRQARRAESAKEHDRRVGVRTRAAVKVIDARAAAQERISKARKAEKAYNAKQPVRVQKARNAAAELKPKKNTAVVAPAGVSRKRAQSPSVKQNFNSAVGDYPVTVNVKASKKDSTVLNPSGITPAEASLD